MISAQMIARNKFVISQFYFPSYVNFILKIHVVAIWWQERRVWSPEDNQSFARKDGE